MNLILIKFRISYKNAVCDHIFNQLYDISFDKIPRFLGKVLLKITIQ